MKAAALALSLLLVTTGCVPRLYLGRRAGLEYPTTGSELQHWAHQITDEVDGVAFHRAGPVCSDFENGICRIGEVGWRQLTSFAHVSDVQIRDYSVRYHGPFLSRLVDLVVRGTERRGMLDQYDEYPFLAMVGAINSIAEKQALDFVIHTGDAIEVSTAGELLRFLSIANQLRLPWYNVMGNHDIFVFGNFAQDYVRVDNISRGFELIAERQEFMQMHGGDLPAPMSGGVTPSRLIGLYGRHQCTEEPEKCIKDRAVRVPPSRYHGFDNFVTSGQVGLRPYYSFAVADPDLKRSPLRMIVLDTTVDDTQVRRFLNRQYFNDGASGYVGEAQATWLIQELIDARHRGQAVLVFGHHPLSWPTRFLRKRDPNPVLTVKNPSAGRDEPLRDLLLRYDHVLGYFGGHTHKAQIQMHSRPDDAVGFLEIIAPSVHEYPQAALLVSVMIKDETRELALHIEPLVAAVSDVQRIATARATAFRTKLDSACRGAIRERSLKNTVDCRVSIQQANSFHMFKQVSILPRKSPTATIKAAGTIVACPKSTHDITVELEGSPPFSLLWSDGFFEESVTGSRIGSNLHLHQRTVFIKDRMTEPLYLRSFQDSLLPGNTEKGNAVTFALTQNLAPRASPEEVCVGGIVMLASGANANVKWRRGGQEFGVGSEVFDQPKNSGLIEYTVLDGCDIPYSVSVTVHDPPNASFTTSSDLEYSRNALIRLNITGGTPPFTVTWSDQKETSTEERMIERRIVKSVASYTAVALKDANGCRRELNLKKSIIPVTEFTADSVNVPRGSTVTIEGAISPDNSELILSQDDVAVEPSRFAEDRIIGDRRQFTLILESVTEATSLKLTARLGTSSAEPKIIAIAVQPPLGVDDEFSSQDSEQSEPPFGGEQAEGR